MHQSSSPLAPKARAKIAETLNARLADGLDLHSQIKVAHWNIKGPQFAALHPLFETFAVGLANHNDSIAERAVTLGASSYGTVREPRRPRHSRTTRRTPFATWITCACSTSASKSISRACINRAASPKRRTTPIPSIC